MARSVNEMLLEVNRCDLVMAGKDLDKLQGIRVCDVESHDERFFFVLQTSKGVAPDVISINKFPWIIEMVPRVIGD